VLLVAVLLVVPGAPVGRASATAATAGTPVSLTLDYSCPFPVIGPQVLRTAITAMLPERVEPGGPITTTDFVAVVTVPASTTGGLVFLGAATIEGTAVATVTNGAATTAIPGLRIPATPVPPAGSFTVRASGPVPVVTALPQGPTVLTVGPFSTTLTPRDAQRAATGLGTFTANCTLLPGRRAVLATVTRDAVIPAATATATPDPALPQAVAALGAGGPVAAPGGRLDRLPVRSVELWLQVLVGLLAVGLGGRVLIRRRASDQR
jgi:hypothetical protein